MLLFGWLVFLRAKCVSQALSRNRVPFITRKTPLSSYFFPFFLKEKETIFRALTEEVLER